MPRNSTEVNIPKNAGWQVEEYTATITTTSVAGLFTAAITFDREFAATPRRLYAYAGGTYGRVAIAVGADNLSTTGAVAFARSGTNSHFPDGTITVTVAVHGRFV